VTLDIHAHEFEEARVRDDIGEKLSRMARLRDGSMPCDGAWPDEHVALRELGRRRKTG
jgi:hypothetical protein